MNRKSRAIKPFAAVVHRHYFRPSRTFGSRPHTALRYPRRSIPDARRVGGHEEPMAQLSEVKVPDIGNYTNVPVIEVLVKPGDSVNKDQGLVTLESDKATMEVPSTADGVVKEVRVKLGDEVSEGSVVVVIEAAGAAKSPLAPAREAGAHAATGEGGAGKGASPVQTPPSPQPSPASGRGGENTRPVD